MGKRIIFIATNNLNYDQRMQKICTSLAKDGYEVLLLGVKKFLPIVPLTSQPFKQKRLSLFFKGGFLSFAESNLRFFLYLLFKKFDAICAIDLDTIIPVYLISVIKRKKRIYDAHELFCEMYSIAAKKYKIIYFVWKSIEKMFLPQFKKGYTVNKSLSAEFESMYNLNYQPIYNVPVLRNCELKDREKISGFLLYQGVVNTGRGLQNVIPAMKRIDYNLKICGGGNYLEEAILLSKKLKLDGKIEFYGNVLPDELRKITNQAYIGLNTFDNLGKNDFYSLSNRTFDYMYACVPQIAMNFPEYKMINEECEIAILIDNADEDSIVNAVNRLLEDKELYNRLSNNCRIAQLKYNWANEEKKLLTFYKNLFLEKS